MEQGETYDPDREEAIDDDSEEDEESTGKNEDQRSAYARDRDRILYSREFRRLKDITQVARVGEAYLHHDRLTHSLKVAQVGRRLAELFIDVYEDHDLPVGDHLNEEVVEAACLAHDIGHPPFGHIAEKKLDEKVVNALQDDDDDDTATEQDNEAAGETNEETATEENEAADDETGEEAEDSDSVKPPGYEGNPQSFRVVTRLASHRRSDAGLDLTRATLNAIQKYPWERGEEVDYDEDSEKKWGYYETERAYFEFARQSVDANRDRTLEAEIMDYADDLTYAIHDMDDFYRDSILPLDQILRETIEFCPGDVKYIQPSDAQNIVEEKDSLPANTELRSFAVYMEDEADTDVPIDRWDVARFFLEIVLSPTVSGEVGEDGDTNRSILDVLTSSYGGTSIEQDALNELTSFLIDMHFEALEDTPERREYVEVVPSEADGKPTLSVNPIFKENIEILKELTVYYVINNSTLMAQQHGHQEIIETLFDELYEEANPEDNVKLRSAIPEPFKNRLADLETAADPQRARIVSDIIANLTEPQAIQLHDRLTGDSPGSLQNEIIR